jgi:hypothetical protein
LEHAFWGGVSLALLGMLIGLLVLMITEDLRAHLERRRT